jgi:hypothetical protein
MNILYTVVCIFIRHKESVHYFITIKKRSAMERDYKKYIVNRLQRFC